MAESCGNSSCTPVRRLRTPVVMPDTIVIGNSRPFAPWMVRMRTASSSVSGSTVSTTRAPSALWRSAQRRKSRRPPPPLRPGADPLTSENARAWSITKRTRRHRSRGRPCANASLEDTALAHDAVEQLARTEPEPRVVPPGERAHRIADRVVARQRLGKRRLVIPVPAVVDAERVEVVVTASEQRRAQRADQGELVGGIVDRLQHLQQVADLARAVDERRRLGAVRNARGVERVFQLTE